MLNEYITKVKGEFRQKFVKDLTGKRIEDQYWDVVERGDKIESFLESSLREFVSELKGKIEGLKVSIGHAEECLATENGDSYCDCSDYISLHSKNETLKEVLALLEDNN